MAWHGYPSKPYFVSKIFEDIYYLDLAGIKCHGYDNSYVKTREENPDSYS